MKWVHRSCLDTWRSVSPNPDSFHSCDTCHCEYRFMVEDCSERLGCKDRAELFVAIMILLVLVGVGMGVMGVFAEGMLGPYISWYLGGIVPFLLAINDYARGFITGPTLFFAVIGIISIIMGIIKCVSDEPEEVVYVADDYPYRHNYFIAWYWIYWGPIPRYHHGGCGACGCGGCGNVKYKLPSGGGQAMAIVILVVILALAIIGAISGIFFSVYFISKMINRKRRIVRLRSLANKYIVADLSNRNQANIAVDYATANASGRTFTQERKPLLEPTGPKKYQEINV